MSKKAICLVSDGLDSPIATYLLEQKGIEVFILNFFNFPFVGYSLKKNQELEENKIPIIHNGQISNIAQALVNAFQHQKSVELIQMPHGEDLKKIIESISDKKITCVLCKRLMLKKAEFIANILDADLIVTGDILGEQASQTIDNLKVIQEALKNKKLIRPNIGLNKEQVISLAKEIGTYQFSELAAKFTCTAVPNKPSTKADLEQIISIENELEIEKMIQESWKRVTRQTFTRKEDSTTRMS
ncbi:MAG: hypothetical protein ACFFDW_04055 [Candidatus Thorarchaeota archaeon]